MRNALVSGIGGLVIGHIGWLIAISLAINTTAIDRWVLVVAAGSLLIGGVSLALGWRRYREQSNVRAAFLLCLPIAPILLSLIVLGVTYL